jgi:hypothetical protein
MIKIDLMSLVLMFCVYLIFIDKIPLQPKNAIVNSRPYRLSFSQKDNMESLIMQLLNNKVIKPSVSLYSSSTILVKKTEGSWRLCIDYMKLNNLTVKNLLDEMHGAKIFSKIVLRSGYHQIRMHPKDIPKTAFNTHQGHFEYLVMRLGLLMAQPHFKQ